ncbi:retrotransposon protein [Cucumis melo var. makuwa]|uniref:Retrotransposon protein n=1 Tax=Cucumis melo var. makuwa TaxID=1194695 RepID=A0A5A7UGW0_CUCMM|nr:retrotransposon protein [Cucumis melo var. makuwa]
MTNIDIKDDIDEVDSTHATSAGDDINYIEMSNEWTQWRDELAEEMFSDWELRRGGHHRVPRGVSQCWWVEVRQRDVSARSHPAAEGLLNKLFLHYDELSYVFGKDRATGGRAETFADVGSNDPAGYEAFVADVASDMDFQSMYSQGLNMSPDELMGTRITRVSEGRYVSSGSKRKRGGQATGNASQTRQEVVRQLEAIPELTLMDRYRSMHILMRNVDDMKAFLDVSDNMKYPYCSIILQENR